MFILCILNNKCLLCTNICTNKWCKFVLNYSHFYVRTLKKKVKVTLVQALRLCTDRMAHRRSRDIALLFHDEWH
jgi:hypothetical protein